MHTLIAFATQWGSKYGGINSFNTDFMSAFGVAYNLRAQIICIVASATQEEINAVLENVKVRLVPLPYPPQDKLFSIAQAQAGIDELKRLNITFDPYKTVWLGHDRITGAAANAAVKIAGGCSALIHHMSYDHYESYAENSNTAYEKTQEQFALFQQADLVLAIGPLLRDALTDLLKTSKQVHMLIPGLAEISPRSTPITFTAFLSGRFSDDATRIKQGHLGIAAFAKAHCEARKNEMPDGLCSHPKLVLRGVDFEKEAAKSSSDPLPDPETELKKFAEKYAQCVINLHALPYTQDRETLYAELSAASVALMPSWHEGFGLVAWEAIAAGVPLIISKHSGVYRLLKGKYPGNGTGCVYPIDVHAAVSSPFFRQEDLEAVVTALKAIANEPAEARKKAGALRELLGDYTWTACAEEATKAFGWSLQKGSMAARAPEDVAPTPNPKVSDTALPIPFTTTNSPIQIPVKRWKTGIGLAESQLLRAEEALVPFDSARQPELDALNTWLEETNRPQAVRLITGAGGLGKTRLAIELCNQRMTSGWHAGFLDAGLDARELTISWQTLRNLNQPLLIVIDYAETRQTDLLSIIKVMLQDPGNHPVRLLLLARDGGEWWDNLPSKDSLCEPLLSGYATSGPFHLPPLHVAEEDRRRAYQIALKAFANILGVTAPDFVPELAGDHFERPLYLQMAALLALYGERPLTAEGLTKALLNHERRYWRRLLANFAWPEPERHAQLLLALTTLAGGFATSKDARIYWSKASGNSFSATDFTSMFYALVPLYPGKQGLQAVRPDLLGEALVAQALLRPEAANVLYAVLGKNAVQPIRRNALTVIARLSSQRLDLHETLSESLASHFPHCCQDLVAVITETNGQLPVLAEIAFTRLSPTVKSQVAGVLSPMLREESVQLAELSCLVNEYLAEKCRQKQLKKSNIENRAAYAGVLINLSVSLSRTGKDNHALSCALEAFKHFRDLNRINRQCFEPDYARSLGNYASNLSDAGQNKLALDHARQALDIRRRLAQRNPDRYESDYARSLGNYAIRLRDAGQNELALEHALQALDIHQRLAQKNSDRYEPDYAGSLNNYASHLSNAGQNEQALDHARQALDIYQRLVQKNPDRYEPDYAMSLNTYVNSLRDAGQNESALKHAGQALDIRQRLVQKNPDRYNPDYAVSLNNYAIHLRDAGQNESALKHAGQALDIRQRLVQKNPDRYNPDYAVSLNNYAIRLRDAGQNKPALDHARQALDIYQRLVQKNPDRYEPDYAGSLNNYASHLSNAGQNELALERAHQALDLRQQLVQKNPDRHEPDYALALNNYASNLSDAGQNEPALDHARQALDIYQRLAQKNPDRFDEDLFSITCFAHFFSWLCGHSDNEVDLTSLSTIPTTIPEHRHSLLLIYAYFVQACWATNQPSRTEAFKQVTSIWGGLSLADKTQAQEYWLCAVAWCAVFAPDAVAEFDWEANFHQYANERHGNLPHWMQEVARRLMFQWPAMNFE